MSAVVEHTHTPILTFADPEVERAIIDAAIEETVKLFPAGMSLADMGVMLIKAGWNTAEVLPWLIKYQDENGERT